MKFLNSFMYAAFLLIAICAALSCGRPKGSTDKVPIEMKFFHYGHNLDCCAYDDYDYSQDYYDYSNQQSDEWQFKLRLLLEKVLENNQKNDSDHGHTIRYVLGKREPGDALVLSAGQKYPNHEYPAKELRWGREFSHIEGISITTIELNITQTSTLGKAYLIPGGNRFLLGVELVNARPLGYDVKVYGFYVLHI